MNRALAGKTYPPQALTLDAGRVAAFAAAVGHPGGGVPPTFATALEHAALPSVVGDPELGLDYSRVVHGEQEYEWGRPMKVGETLSAEVAIESIRAKGGLEMLTIRTDMRDGGGRTVVIARTTLIVRSP
jgi:acyl dehydratase